FVKRRGGGGRGGQRFGGAGRVGGNALVSRPSARLTACAIASSRCASVQARWIHASVRGQGSGAGMSEELGTIDDKAAAAPLELRDEDGAVRADYVERVAQA